MELALVWYIGSFGSKTKKQTKSGRFYVESKQTRSNTFFVWIFSFV